MADTSDLGRGRVVVITGAAGGIGRGEALAFARHGFRVVVNDLGTDRAGEHRRSDPAEQLVAEIRAAGGEAIANGEDVADFDGARRVVDAALAEWSRLDVVVNNAGILRDRTLANMTIEEWDSVIRVHLRGTFCMSRHAAAHWRDLAKTGTEIDARMINTTSTSGIFGNTGQVNYGTAKAGIALMTIVASQELARYGVKVNAIAPLAHTRMTDDRPVGDGSRRIHEEDPNAFNPYDPENVAPIVVWLAGDAAREVTGRVFDVRGGVVRVLEPWTRGPEADKGARWEVAELDAVVPDLLRQARPVETLKSNPGTAV